MKKNNTADATDATASDVWAEVSALQAGAKELFNKALRVHKEDVCNACAELEPHGRRYAREEQQRKLDRILWQATALLNIASDRIADHYSEGDEEAEKGALLPAAPENFTLVLSAAGENKINVIKAVRTIADLGLKEAKDLVEGAPKTVKEGLLKEQATAFAEMLKAQGATVEIRGRKAARS